MVEDRCVCVCARNACRSEVCERVPCKSVVGEISVGKGLYKWCVKGSYVKVMWVKEWCGTGVGVKVLCVQDMRGKVCVKELCVKELCGTEVCAKVWCKNVLCVKVLYVQVLWISGECSCYVAITDVPTPGLEVNGNRRSWQHGQCGRAGRADHLESGRSAAGSWRMRKVVSSHGTSREPSFKENQAPQVPRLPHTVQVDVTKCHACRTKNSHSVHSDKQEPSAPPEPAQCHKCHTKRSMPPSATPATQSEGLCLCRQKPRLPRRMLCVIELCVSKLCVRELCVRELC